MKKKTNEQSTVIITKVIIMENDSLVIIGSGFLITKADGYQRLDIQDLKGNHLPPAWYDVKQTDTWYLGFTTDRIQ